MLGISATVARLAGATALAALAAGCGPTPYGPAASLGGAGYETTQLTQNRYLVSFEGNAATSRQRVETYMLFRAAEVAAQTGHPYFAIVRQDTERDVDVNVFHASPGLYGHGPRRGRGFGIRGGFGFPYYSSVGYGLGPTVTTTDSYEAYATVEMLNAPPSGRTDVFETQDVISTLTPQVRRPET